MHFVQLKQGRLACKRAERWAEKQEGRRDAFLADVADHGWLKCLARTFTK